MLVTNRAMHLCSMQWRGWPLKTPPPPHADIAGRWSNSVGISKQFQKIRFAGGQSPGGGGRVWPLTPCRSSICRIWSLLVERYEDPPENIASSRPAFHGHWSLKVIRTDMYRSGVYDFLLTFHCNLEPIVYRFRETARYWPKSCEFFKLRVFSTRRGVSFGILLRRTHLA